VTIDYSEDGRQLLGTAGALRRAQAHFQPHALVLNGDTYFDIDYQGLIGTYLTWEPRPQAFLAVTNALAHGQDDRTRYGTVILDTTQRYVLGFQEKAARPLDGAGWTSAGTYVIHRDLLDHVPAGVPSSLERDILPALIARGSTIAAATYSEPFYDIGTPESLDRFVALQAVPARVTGNRDGEPPTPEERRA
jgi:NDP-sugar pyrophosphorylase family protein